jgi:7-carboxy-7-deazaguanine synthase
MSEIPTYPVCEIFGPTLQGEGIHSGRVATFIRFAGCDSNCEWCDTKYAWDTGGVMQMDTTEIVVETIKHMHGLQKLVVITGGNPALYNLGDLVDRLHAARIEVHVETQGTKFPAWLGKADFISFSPKPSKEVLKGNWLPMKDINRMLHLIKNITKGQLKFIIDTDEEYAYAKNIASIEPTVPMVFQPKFVIGKAVSIPHDLGKLADKMCADWQLTSNVRFAPQMHRILWSDKHGK